MPPSPPEPSSCRYPVTVPRLAGSPPEARGAHAIRIAQLLVATPLLGIELGGYAVKILRVAGLITSKHGVGDVIGQLDDPGRPGIDEQRRVRKVS